MGLAGWVGVIANTWTNFTGSPGSSLGGNKVQAFRQKHSRQIIRVPGGTSCFSREPHYKWAHPSQLTSPGRFLILGCPQTSKQNNLTVILPTFPKYYVPDDVFPLLQSKNIKDGDEERTELMNSGSSHFSGNGLAEGKFYCRILGNTWVT